MRADILARCRPPWSFDCTAARNPDFPNHKAIYRHFQSTANMLRELAEWAKNRADYADVAKMLGKHAPETKLETKRPTEGFVYLIRWGVHYKIGRGDQLERRVKQVKTGLPDSGTLVHAIRTDDPTWYRGVLASTVCRQTCQEWGSGSNCLLPMLLHSSEGNLSRSSRLVMRYELDPLHRNIPDQRIFG